VAWRPDAASSSPPPKGATGDGGFRATPEMMSILGCSAGELGNVLQALGFRLERVPLAPVSGVVSDAGQTEGAVKSADTAAIAPVEPKGEQDAEGLQPMPTAEDAGVPS